MSTYATIVTKNICVNTTKNTQIVSANITKKPKEKKENSTKSTQIVKKTIENDAKIKHNFKVQCQALKKKLTLVENHELKNRMDNASAENQFLVGGLDLSLIGENGEMVCGYVIYSFKGPKTQPKLVYCDSMRYETTIPYKAGYLGFREAEPMVKTVQTQLKKIPNLKPHVLLVDGNGIFHPMGFGSACHIGVHLNIPTIGIGKKMHFFGSLQNLKSEIPRITDQYLQKRFDVYKINENGQTIGCMMNSSEHFKPIYVSQGYAISLETSLEIVQKCLHKAHRRLPEPIFAADLYSRRKAAESNNNIEDSNSKFKKFLQRHYEMPSREEKLFWGKNLSKPLKECEIRDFYNHVKKANLAQNLEKLSLRPNKSRKNSISSDSGNSDEEQSTQLLIKSMQFSRTRTSFSKK